MGWHDCPKPSGGYIHGNATVFFNNKSSGDNTVSFASGNSWRFPDGMLYYIVDCGWQPPAAFIDDVMHSTVTSYSREQTRSAGYSQSIGYLDEAAVNAARSHGWNASTAGFGDFLRKLESSIPDLVETQKTRGATLEEIIAHVEPLLS